MYSQKGFSLVELLIAIAVLSMVIAGSLMAFQVLLQNTASNTLYTNIGQEADFVLRKMERELKQTGYHYPSSNYNTIPKFHNGHPIKVDGKRIDICFDRSFENRVVISYNYNPAEDPADNELKRAELQLEVGEDGLVKDCNSRTPVDWEPVIKGLADFKTSTQDDIKCNKNILIEMWLNTQGDNTKKFQTSVNLSNLLIEDNWYEANCE